MNKSNKVLIKIWPYVACIVAGSIFSVVATKLDGDLKGLTLSISAALFAIPFLYVIYELAQKNSKKKLNKELFDYAKMQIDREVLSIINQLMKIVRSYEKRDFSLQGIQAFLSQSEHQIREYIDNNDYLGFQVFKNWSISERNIHSIIENPFILQRLEDEQIISIIGILKTLRMLEDVQKRVDDLYEVTDKITDSYKIQSGRELSDENVEYPNRYLLLKHLVDDEYQVADFGDFPRYQIGKLLNICKVNRKYLEAYTNAIYGVLKQINEWLELSGSEFLLDTRMFRLGFKTNREQVTGDNDCT